MPAHKTLHFADASVIINLLAMDVCERIIDSIGAPLNIAGQVAREIRRHPRGLCEPDESLRNLVRRGRLTIHELTDEQCELFLELVGVPAPEDLGDGESATIVLAAAHRASAVLDDARARRISANRFPTVKQLFSVDLVSLALDSGAITKDEARTALVDARRYSRLHVPVEARSWVSSLTEGASEFAIGKPA